MNADELSAALRSGDTPVRLDRIEVSAGGEKFRGTGVLEVKGDDLQIRVTLSKRSKLPNWHRSVWSEADFWKVRARVEHSVSFTATNVIPIRQITRGDLIESTLRFTSFKLAFARRSTTKYRKLFDEVAAKYRKEEQLPIPLPLPAPVKKRKASRIAFAKFEAVVVGCKPIVENVTTLTVTKNSFLGKTTSWDCDTFVEKTSNYEIALIERKDELHIHLRTRGRYKSDSAIVDRKRFQALLEAVGFTHGFNPWPFRLEQWREGGLIESRFSVPRVPPKTTHAPFDKSLAASGYPPPLWLVMRFFQKDTPLSRFVSDFLSIFRQAGEESVHLPVRTLAFCSLFEGLIHRLFQEFKLERQLRKQRPDARQFLAARDALIKTLVKKGAKGDLASKRLAGLLGHAEPFRVKDQFYALCDRFGLDQKAMKRHFDAWFSERNPLMHGQWRNHSDQDFERQSLIAGAINIFLLKLMGYSGKMVASRFAFNHSDVYRRI